MEDVAPTALMVAGFRAKESNLTPDSGVLAGSRFLDRSDAEFEPLSTTHYPPATIVTAPLDDLQIWASGKF